VRAACPLRPCSVEVETLNAHHAHDRRERLQLCEDGQPIGRIRYASERAPGIWLWHVQVHIPGPSFESSTSLHEAKAHFKAAWLAFKERHGPEKLAKA
jgi:hypothetical protein